MGESGRGARDLLEDAAEERDARKAAGCSDLLLTGAGVLRSVFLCMSDPERVDQVREGRAVGFVDQPGDVGLVGLQPTGHFRYREMRLQKGFPLEDEAFKIGIELAWHGVSYSPRKGRDFLRQAVLIVLESRRKIVRLFLFIVYYSYI